MDNKLDCYLKVQAWDKRLNSPLGSGVAIVDHHFRIVAANSRLLDIFSVTRGEVVGRTFMEITYGEDTPLDLMNAEKVMAGIIPDYIMEKRYIFGNRIIPAVLRVSALHNQDGSFAFFMAEIIKGKLRPNFLSHLRRSLSLIRENITILMMFGTVIGSAVIFILKHLKIIDLK